MAGVRAGARGARGGRTRGEGARQGREPGAGAAARAVPPSKQQVKRARNLESEIEQAEAALAALERELADPQAWNDPRASAKSTRRHAEAKARIESLYAELEAVAS